MTNSVIDTYISSGYKKDDMNIMKRLETETFSPEKKDTVKKLLKSYNSVKERIEAMKQHSSEEEQIKAELYDMTESLNKTDQKIEENILESIDEIVKSAEQKKKMKNEEFIKNMDALNTIETYMDYTGIKNKAKNSYLEQARKTLFDKTSRKNISYDKTNSNSSTTQVYMVKEKEKRQTSDPQEKKNKRSFSNIFNLGTAIACVFGIMAYTNNIENSETKATQEAKQQTIETKEQDKNTGDDPLTAYMNNYIPEMHDLANTYGNGTPRTGNNPAKTSENENGKRSNSGIDNTYERRGNETKKTLNTQEKTKKQYLTSAKQHQNEHFGSGQEATGSALESISENGWHVEKSYTTKE